ncbi:LysR family transcriptional regulator [Erwinia sp. JUb26]|uniref:LysR family transcriptional regulator n=1 Tax=Erwinia sp. JUb26 TaxID=2485126 RepID=UPI000FA379D6|nr:LysR family transcriptional regulator [Erwinia sp. JUb26]ROR13140.1 LysR family transcriptional regulator [Erwinia sp. JUb26]
MNNRELGYFMEAARIMNLGQASQNLNITQPALSKSIARLEKDLNIKLFKRSGRGLALTEAGDILYQRGLMLQSSWDDVAKTMAELSHGRRGVVRVGSAGSATQFLLPEVCKRLQQDAPNVKLEIQIGMNDVLFNLLDKHELDIIVGPLVGYNKPVVQLPVTTDRVVVAASRSHPLANGPASLRDLSRHGWILPAKTVSMRQWLERIFYENHCAAPEVKIEISSLAAVPGLIASSGLLSFISENSLAEKEFASLLTRIDNNQLVMTRRVGITWLQDAFLSPATQQVIDITCAYGKK